MCQCGGYNNNYYNGYGNSYGGGYDQGIVYAPYDPCTGKNSIAQGLHNSQTHAVSIYDNPNLGGNGDGTVQTWELGQNKQHLDLNNDGVFSAGEQLAYTMFKDSFGSNGNPDGRLTMQENRAGEYLNQRDPSGVRSIVQKIYNNLIAQYEGADISRSNCPDQDSQNPMQMFMMFFMMMSMNKATNE